MARLWDPGSHRKDNLRYHYNSAWAGPLEVIPEPPITAEESYEYTGVSVIPESKPATNRRSRSAQKLVNEDSSANKQSKTSFGETLKILRLRSGQSRYRLAESSGITEPYILRLESGYPVGTVIGEYIERTLN